MSSRFSSGKNAIAICDVCGFQYKLSELKPVFVKLRNTNILACCTCWDPDQPQLQLGMYPVDDPQAVRNPRPDNSYYQSGLNNEGNPSDGSRIIQWGWNPVGLNNPLQLADLTDTLQSTCSVGDVTVTTS